MCLAKRYYGPKHFLGPNICDRLLKTRLGGKDVYLLASPARCRRGPLSLTKEKAEKTMDIKTA